MSRTMDLSVTLDYTQDVVALLPEIRALESAGVDGLWIQEGYSFDAVSAIGFLAAHTGGIRLGTAILNVFSRSPALLAMTAAGCDHLSGGRFSLGLGSSGPQVVEGFHGVGYDRPLTRIRETIDVCRMVWRREPLRYEGRTVTVPLTERGRPLKLVNQPVRPAVPVYWAALGDRSVTAAAETADGWLPFFFVPERSDRAFGDALRDGTKRRDPVLGALDVVAHVDVAVGEGLDADRLLAPPAPGSRCTWAEWAHGSRTTTTHWPAAWAGGARPPRSRTTSWPGDAPRPLPPCPLSGCPSATSSAPSPGSPSGWRPSPSRESARSTSR